MPSSSPDDQRLERAVLITVGLGGMLIPLNSTMVAVAIPNISRELNASVSATGWLVTAYLIVMAACQPISGKLGDRYGRRMFLLTGYSLFGLASLGCALAPNISVLIACRAGQAIAGAVIFPNGSALLRQIVPEVRRGARFGLLGSSIAFGAAIGPPLGGVLVEVGDWPALFLVNLPWCVILVAIAWRTIPHDRPERTSSRFDLIGSGLLTVVLATGAWLLTSMDTVASSVAISLGAVIAVAFAAFIRHELRHPDPVVQPRFFRRPVFAAATAGIALSNVGLYVLLLVVPFILEGRPGWSEARIGLVLTSMSIGMVVLAPIGGRLSDRLGRRWPALVGMTFLSTGTVALAFGGSDIPGVWLVVVLAISGIGIGLGSGSLQTSAIESIEPEHAGMASGASMTSRYLGSIVGSAVLAGVIAGGNGIAPVLWMTAAAACGAAVVALWLPTRVRRVADSEIVPLS